MKLKCAWCEREGKPANVADVEPLANISETHGLCGEHHRQWLSSLGLSVPSNQAPPGQETRPSA
jgi:hypothetical protein